MAELFGSVKRVKDVGWAFSYGNEGWPEYLYKYFSNKDYGSSAAAKAAVLAHRKDPELQNKLLKVSKPYKAAQKYGVPYEEWIKKSEVERLKYPQGVQNKRIAELKKAKDITPRTFTYKTKSYVMPTKLPIKSLPYYKDFIRYLNDYIINRKPGTSVLEAILTIPDYKNEPVVGGKKPNWERGQGRIWRDLSEYFLKGKKGNYRTLATASFFDDINIKNLIPKKDHLEVANLKQARTAEALTHGTASIAEKVKSGEVVLGNPLVKPIAEFISKNPSATKEELISAIRKSEGKNLTDREIRKGAVRAHSNIITRAMAIGRGEKISETHFIALKDLDSAALRVGANALFKIYPDQIHRTFQKTVEEYYKNNPRLLKKSLNKLKDFESIKKKLIKEFNLTGSSLRDAPFQFDHPISIKALERSGDLAGAVRTNPIAGDVNQFKTYLDQKLNTYQKNIIKGTNVDVNLANVEKLQNINKTLLGKLAGDFTMDQKGIIKVIDYGAKDILDPKYNILESLKENIGLGRRIKETAALRDPALVEDVGALFGKEGSSKFFKGAKKLATLDESKIVSFIDDIKKGPVTGQYRIGVATGCIDANVPLPLASGGRARFALGTGAIRCIENKIRNQPLESSQKIMVGIEEGATGFLGRIRNAARGFLGALGKWGPKVGKYGAIAAAGALAQPLVKQFMNDDPSTYLTDPDQQAGMLEALIEGEQPKPRSEILDWGTTAGAVGATAAAVPGSGAMYKYRRGLSEAKIPKAGPITEAGLTAGDYLSKHAGKGYGKIRAGAGVGLKALSGMFTPAGLLATEPLRIAQQRREGESWGDIATDPFTWMGPAFAPEMTRIATAGMKKGSLLPKLLRLGISRGALAAMGPVGWAGLAASLGWTGYEQYQDYKKGRGFFASDED